MLSRRRDLSTRPGNRADDGSDAGQHEGNPGPVWLLSKEN
jgi:hypothetical protein